MVGRLVLRRVVLMVPTLVGVTFLVFCLITLSPGGAVPSWVSADASTSGVVRRGLINDRLGLDDPLLVQYGRWLNRVSPVKVGSRPLVDPSTGAAVPAVRPLPGRDGFTESDSDVGGSGKGNVVARYRAARVELYRAREAYLLAREAGDDEGMRAARASWLGWKERVASLMEELTWDRAGRALIPGVVWVGSPDLGVSWARGRPISEILSEALPVTLVINGIASVAIYLLAVPLGTWSGARAGTRFDRVSSGVVLALWSLPLVWVATLSVTLLTSGEALDWFPSGGLHSDGAEGMRYLPSFREDGFERGYLLDALWHIALPVGCLIATGLALVARQTREAVAGAMGRMYVTSARARGVPERRVIVEHALRNALLPLITIFTALLPALLAGSVVVETVFSIPGVGLLTVEAINLRDRELMLALTLVVSVVNLVALVLADVFYMLADPRVRDGAMGGGS